MTQSSGARLAVDLGQRLEGVAHGKATGTARAPEEELVEFFEKCVRDGTTRAKQGDLWLI
jgi:hypothetical protein